MCVTTQILAPCALQPCQRSAWLLHHFQMAIAQRIGSVPANANQNHVDQEAHSFVNHRLQLSMLQVLRTGEFDQWLTELKDRLFKG